MAYIGSGTSRFNTADELTVTGNAEFNGNATFADNDKVIFGAGSDLQIYHDAGHSRIVDAGTGNLRIQADNLRLQTADGTGNYISADNGGAATLYHNALPKLATTATGVDVTGNLTVDGGTITAGASGTSGQIDAPESFVINIDSDNNSTTRAFVIKNNGSAEIARFTEDGKVGIGSSSVATNFRQEIVGLAGSNTSSATSGTTQNASAVMRIKAGGGFTATLDIGQGGGTGSWLQSTDTTNLATTYPLLLNPAGGNVGIGGSPSYKLDVVGNARLNPTSNPVLRFAENGTLRGLLTSSSSLGLSVETSGTLPFIVQTNSAERLRVDGSGNVGLGLSSPEARLDILGNSDVTAALKIGPNANFGHHFYDSPTNGDLIIKREESGVQTETMRLTRSGGYVVMLNHASIGVNAPASTRALTVAGATDGSGSSILVCYNSSLAQKFAVRDDGLVSVANNLAVTGSVSKGSGSFKIDHPLPSKKDTHDLVHSFIEGPQADLIYRGRATLSGGTVDVNVDTAAGMTEGTFVLLCNNVQCFTSNEEGWTALRGSVTGNVLTITAQDNTCTDTVSWMVIGERKDTHMLDTEWTDENGKVIVEPTKVTS